MLSTRVPLVSIIIPAFNEREWICSAIDSALAQTHPACEIIVVDDGSTDGTAALIHEKYGQAITCIQQHNRGLAAARNAGLKAANGKYLQFLDADDVLLPEKVALHVSFLEADTACTIVYSDFAFVDADRNAATTPSGFRDRYRSGHVFHDLLHDNFIVVHAALGRAADVREAGGFDEQLSACEDYDLWLRLAASGRTFGHTPDVLVLYRRRAGSMSADSARQIAATIDAVDKVPTYASLDSEGWRLHRRRLVMLREMMARALLLDAVGLARKGRVDRAVRALLRAFQADPAALPRSFARMAAGGGWRTGRRREGKLE